MLPYSDFIIYFYFMHHSIENPYMWSTEYLWGLQSWVVTWYWLSLYPYERNRKDLKGRNNEHQKSNIINYFEKGKLFIALKKLIWKSSTYILIDVVGKKKVNQVLSLSLYNVTHMIKNAKNPWHGFFFYELPLK